MQVYLSRTVFATRDDQPEQAIEVAVAHDDFHWVCMTRTCALDHLTAVPQVLVHYRGRAGMACLIANNLMRHLHAGGWQGTDDSPFDDAALSEPQVPVMPIEGVLFP